MKKGLMVVTNNIEDGEALFTRALLKRSGLLIDTVSVISSKSLKTAYELDFMADFLINEINTDDYDFLVIPGGKYVGLTIEHDTVIKDLANTFYSNNKVIAAICAGPRFLGVTGILDNKKYTAFPGSEAFSNKGIYQPELKVCKDQNIITARSAGAVYEFSYEIVKTILGEEKSLWLKENILL